MKIVIVLLATYNGINWLPVQIESILKQNDVKIILVVSDDMSTDGTWEYLQSLAELDNRVTLLPRQQKFSGAAKNFYHLLESCDLQGADYFAFADQDDIWSFDKLIRQIELLEAEGYAAVSSDVEAFWPNGKTATIIKSQPQRRFDFLFESAGPGCSFLMTPWLVGELKKVLGIPELHAYDIALHDWLTYAVCRASGGRWLIDSIPTLQYRQHGHNELGANKGLKAFISRLKKITGGWYYAEVLKIARVCQTLTHQADLLTFCTVLTQRKGLLGYIGQCRRKLLDRIVLFGIFIFWILRRPKA